AYKWWFLIISIFQEEITTWIRFVEIGLEFLTDKECQHIHPAVLNLGEILNLTYSLLKVPLDVMHISIFLYQQQYSKFLFYPHILFGNLINIYVAKYMEKILLGIVISGTIAFTWIARFIRRQTGTFLMSRIANLNLPLFFA
ncbi:hypothetical protein ACJX0J_028724, partial [Zea mays]